MGIQQGGNWNQEDEVTSHNTLKPFLTTSLQLAPADRLPASLEEDIRSARLAA